MRQAIQSHVINNAFSNYNPSQQGTSFSYTGQFMDIDIIGALRLKKGIYDTPYIHFENCTFDNFVLFDEEEYTGAIYFENCTFNGFVQFLNCKFKNSVHFKGCKVNKNFRALDTDFESLDLSGKYKFIGIYGGKCKFISIKGRKTTKTNCQIDSIKINFRGIEGTVFISEAEITKLHFTNTIHKDSELFIKDVRFTDLHLDELSNNGRLRLFDLKEQRTDDLRSFFSITNCNLGKAEFTNIDLMALDTTLFRSSYFIDCTFVNIRWPQHLHPDVKDADSITLLDFREVYRQLKYSYSKQGDSVLEYKFHALEMKEQKRYLKHLGAKEKHMPFKERWDIWQTLLVLNLSSWTSDYGQSLWRPIRTILVIGLPLFTLTVALGGIEGYYFSWSNSPSKVVASFPRFLSFVNPLRKYEADDVHWGLLSDFFMRIISSYSIFNFVRASRRFVK